MQAFSNWFIERAMRATPSPTVIAKLQQLLQGQQEVGGLVRGEDVQIISQGRQGGVQMGHAEAIRSLNCDYTFHTHPKDTDVPYPSGKDLVGVYMMGKTDLVVCQTGIWAVTPLKPMQWQEVERVSNEYKKEAKEQHIKTGDQPYWIWKEKIKEAFPVKIEKVV